MVCPGGLDGKEVAVEGTAAAIADVLVRVERLNGASQVFRLTPDQRSHVIEPAPGRWQEVKTYLGMGIQHILMGVDHLLFVLGLLLIVHDRWMLLKTITAFTWRTASHSASPQWAGRARPRSRSTRPSRFRFCFSARKSCACGVARLA